MGCSELSACRQAGVGAPIVSKPGWVCQSAGAGSEQAFTLSEESVGPAFALIMRGPWVPQARLL